MTARLEHRLPRRLRISVPAMRRDPRLAARLRAHLRLAPGVTRATANPLTGSLVLEHDDLPGRQQDIFERLAAAGFPIAPAIPAAPIPQPANRLAEALAQKLLEGCFEQVLGLLIARLA